jgi:hypothetical protein
MNFIYIIVENGEAYPMSYKNYKSAIISVKEKHREYLEEQIKELHCLNMIENLLANINVPENIETGISKLYIEKGINIIIHKIPICE